MILTSAMLCLALNVYHEARGEALVGQYAVAQVTLNRADRNPKKVCSEVFKPKQFSWANPLTSRKGEKRAALVGQFMPKDRKAWEVAKAVAYYSMRGTIQDFTDGSTHYHARWVNPHWNKAMTLTSVIGAHRFYKQT